jgi:ABC-type bacteriocin/lantibiotic exporter with double-glycine peptidase domain
MIISPEAQDYYIVRKLIEFFSYFNVDVKDNVLTFIFLFFIFIIIINTVFRIFMTWYSQNFIKSLGTKIASTSLQTLLSQDYEFLSSKNSSEIVSSLVVKIDEAVNFLIHCAYIFSATILSLSIIIALLVIDFKVSFYLIITFVSIYSCLIFYMRRRTSIISETLSQNFDNRLKSVQDIMSYLRQIFLYNNKDFYLETFISKDADIREANLNMLLYSQFPRICLEAIGIICFSIATFLLINYYGYERIYLVTILTIVVYAFQKLLISFNQIYVSGINILALKNSAWDIFKILKFKNNDQKLRKKIIFNNLDFKNLSFKYKSQKNYVFKNINFEIRRKQKIGIFGKSGSGKSTLLDLICGLLEPTDGLITINKKINIHSNINNWRNCFSYGSQNVFLTDDTIQANIASGNSLSKINHKRMLLASEHACITDFVNLLKNDFKTQIGSNGVRLSGGQMQRISLARALYKDSDILLLDEITNSLDLVTENKILSNIWNFYNNKTIFIVSHNKLILKNCDIILECANQNIYQYKSYQNFIKKNKSKIFL